MAEFIGTTGNDPLTGTDEADTLISFGGRDTILGAGGDDDIVLNNPLVFGAIIDGGEGFDTLILQDFPNPLFSAGQFYPDGAFTSTNVVLTSSLSSIEAVQFDSVAGNQTSLLLGFGGSGQGFVYPNQIGGGGLSEAATITGGDGTDFIILLGNYVVENTPVVTLDAPSFNLVGFDIVDRAYQASDRVVILGTGTANYVINGSAHVGVQHLGGALGNDTLNGSDDMDFLTYSGGTDILLGNGGDDSLTLVNVIQITPNGEIPVFLDGFGTVFDGGEGTDFLVLGGSVSFAGTVRDIEGIYLSPAFTNDLLPGQGSTTRQTYTEVEIDGDTLFDGLPTDLILDGEGALIISITAPGTFDASAFQFDPGSNVIVQFDIDDEGVNADHVVIGTSNGDIFEGGDGNDTFTSGGGADSIELSLGNDIITDFVIGQDKIDLEGAGISSFELAGQFLSQDGDDALFSFIYGGQTNTLRLLNVDSTALTTGDFVFADPNQPRFMDGTDEADSIIGLAGDDFLTGNGGNDTILSGDGVDFIDAGSGDDRIVLDGLIPISFPSTTIIGGEGTDTLVIRDLPDAPFSFSFLAPDGVFSTTQNIVGRTFLSIERIEFESQPGVAALAAIGYGGTVPQQVSPDGLLPTAELVGGDGRDQIVLIAFFQGEQQYSLSTPDFTFVDWQTPDRAYRPEADRLTLLQAGTAGGTMVASSHVGVAYLAGNVGNDTLIGSDAMEMLNGGGGVNELYGEEGDDTLLLINGTTNVVFPDGTSTSIVSTLTGDGSIFDGGGGFDFLGIGGVVDFQGTVSDIEGIWLAPAYANPLPAPAQTPVNSASQVPTELSIGTDILARMPANLLLDGEGTIIVRIVAGDNFDGSAFVFDANAQIQVQISGSQANEMIVGTSNADDISAGAGGDTIIAGPGNDSIDGGNGNDIAVFDGAFADFTISTQGGEVSVSGANGSQTFVRVETFRFTDGDYVLASELVPGASGTLADGHIEGATVYLDVNNNGQLDDGEPTTTTNADGTFVLATDLTGTIRAFGGTDTSTGEENLLTLTAPSGSIVVNPLTTVIQSLVEQGASVAEAEAQVKSAFGLDAGLNLTQSDPIDSANNNPASLAAQKAAVSTAEVAKAVAMSGGDSAATISAVASAVGSAGGATVSLKDSTTLSTVISAGLPGASPETVTQLVQQSQAKVTNIESATDLAEIVEAQVNSAPEFAADSLALTTLLDAAIAFAPVATDSDGDTLTYTAGTAGNGTVTAQGDGSFVYAANAGFLGTDSFQVTADDGFGGTAQQTISITVQTLPGANRFVSFMSDGFVGSLGGRGSVFGTLGHQDITVIDGPGTIGFDASFNRGGDIIRLAGNAADWHVIRVGSSAIFNDGDTFVSVSVGSTGMPVVFADGERLLQFNVAANQMEIAGQAFDTTTFVPVAMPADGSPLPTGADPEATAVMYLTNGANVSVAGAYSVVGTTGVEAVRLVAGEITLDPSFNRGGDTVRLDDPATDYTATRSGSSILLQSGDLEAVIPVGSTGAQLVFADGDTRTLLFDTGVNGITLGGQLIGFDPVQLSAAA